ncbi:MAG TPA: UDP-N-acetylmuramoyl-L-alanyl-D-glutamate--2,6-diaminopimelate ligase [Candidatus Paceibacterota bacterium]|nr:UDP-N-acetylmuramoyl-L-alanyl-D-glutamate--2,6-diaminopimelate ligase [Candidatus Paceibacterota bacterium]
MFREGRLDRILHAIKRFIPKPLFDFGAKIYHPLLSYSGALVYRFPSRHLKVIGVTGTKGKSTTVYFITRILEDAGLPVAAIGSLGFKIRDREWPNTLKMTMPGRWKLQKFLRTAADAGCAYVIMEVPSEGLAQGRHLGVRFDCAVFTGLHPEHIESHGSLEAYRAAKLILFRYCHGLHVINRDDPDAEYFMGFRAQKHLTYGIAGGDFHATYVHAGPHEASFMLGRTHVTLNVGGQFNVSNALAALAVCDAFGIPSSRAAQALAAIDRIPGRMEWVQREPFGVVVDYAHTPDSLRAVYRTLKPAGGRLLCVLGAAGGGRDRWKRPEFGRIAEQYCDAIYLTNEDPFDEDPERIMEDIAAGITGPSQAAKVHRIIDRKEAIAAALTDAQEGDITVITGKGSETSMALAGGTKIPWSDTRTVKDLLQGDHE